MPAEGAAAVRAQVQTLVAGKGHAVDIGRSVAELLDRAIGDGAITPTPALEQALVDLRRAVEPGEHRKLGGKSGEAARMILRIVVRELGPN